MDRVISRETAANAKLGAMSDFHRDAVWTLAMPVWVSQGDWSLSASYPFRPAERSDPKGV